ncbi:MAG: hypothetical protein HND52_18240 [Ignavibacteriae bacterium]|nr:hypothetical protein [Ignavibacteriota bacterium]
MKIKTGIILLLFSVLLSSSNLFAQSCGFGCLGLSGFYVGYTMHNYEADGLNKYLAENLSSNAVNDIPTFSKGRGFRVGANFFRAHFDDFFFSAKGYYQFVDEHYDIKVEQISEIDKYNYKLQSDYFGIGVDFGIPLFKFVDWKIIEGGVNIYRTEVNIESFYLENKVSESEFEQKEAEVGYYVASGVIVHILKDYISIEGTASYNFFNGGDVEDKSSKLRITDNNTNLIEKSGFAAAVQLNLGFPL